ncbi:hypothetical protein P9B04_23190, partial [Crocosphaera sp. Alani8]
LNRFFPGFFLTFNISAFMVTHDVDEAIFLSHKIILLSPRPALTRKQIYVQLSKPRSRTQKEFLEIRSDIMKDFYG